MWDPRCSGCNDFLGESCPSPEWLLITWHTWHPSLDGIHHPDSLRSLVYLPLIWTKFILVPFELASPSPTTMGACVYYHVFPIFLPIPCCSQGRKAQFRGKGCVVVPGQNTRCYQRGINQENIFIYFLLSGILSFLKMPKLFHPTKSFLSAPRNGEPALKQVQAALKEATWHRIYGAIPVYGTGGPGSRATWLHHGPVVCSADAGYAWHTQLW